MEIQHRLQVFRKSLLQATIHLDKPTHQRRDRVSQLKKKIILLDPKNFTASSNIIVLIFIDCLRKRCGIIIIRSGSFGCLWESYVVGKSFKLTMENFSDWNIIVLMVIDCLRKWWGIIIIQSGSFGCWWCEIFWCNDDEKRFIKCSRSIASGLNKNIILAECCFTQKKSTASSSIRKVTKNVGDARP